MTFNASKGIFIKAEAKWYPEWLGNTRRNFGRFTLTFDFYRKLWKGAIFAYDLYADFTAGTLRGTCTPRWAAWERMRGYYEGRYRDKGLSRRRSSCARKIYRRHGIVAWIGGGQVWGTDKFRWDNTLYSFGCGYRFEFKNRMNIRLDYGWGVYGNKTCRGIANVPRPSSSRPPKPSKSPIPTIPAPTTGIATWKKPPDNRGAFSNPHGNYTIYTAINPSARCSVSRIASPPPMRPTTIPAAKSTASTRRSCNKSSPGRRAYL